MDLIYTDNLMRDIGVVTNGNFDYESSTDKDKCTFEISTTIEDNVLSLGAYLYSPNNEYGGRVDSIKIDTAKRSLTANGYTWRGILGKKIIEPEQGQAYYTLTGDLNANISDILTKTNLTDLFIASTQSTITVTYKFSRYIDVYTGIIKMLAAFGYKLTLSWNENSRKMVLEAVPLIDYSNQREITSDLFNFTIQKNSLPTNHLIGLGKGELTSRQVVHKYLQGDGTIGDTPYYTGKDEITEVYDYPNAESLEELETSTTERLKELSVSDSMEIKSAGDLNADIGDKFTALDTTTMVTVTQFVIGKIVVMDGDITKIDYEVGGKIL